MQEDFARFANKELNQPVATADVSNGDDVSTLQQDELVAIELGLLRQQRLNFVDVFREEAAATLKAILKQVRLKKQLMFRALE